MEKNEKKGDRICFILQLTGSACSQAEQIKKSSRSISWESETWPVRSCSVVILRHRATVRDCHSLQGNFIFNLSRLHVRLKLT